MEDQDNLEKENFIKTEFKSNRNVIDQIINKYSYGWITLKVYSLVCLILCVEGIQMPFFSVILIPMKKYFSMNDFQTQIVTSLFFLGVGIGSFLAGFLTEKFSRLRIINLSNLIIALSHLYLGFNDYLIIFTILRFINGVMVGIIVPIALNILTEYLPIKYRSFTLTSVWVGYSVGNIFLLIVILLIMPNYEVENFKLVILLSSSIPILVFLVCLFFMKDSPRNLILNNSTDEAIEIVGILNCKPLSENDRKRIIYETKEKGNCNFEVSLKDLFKGNKMLKTSILLIFIWIINSIGFYGTILISSLTIKGIGIVEQNGTNREIIIDQIIITFISMSANFIGGPISEISIIGRNKATIIAFIFSIVLNILTIIFYNYYSLFFGLFLTCYSIGFNLNTTYSCEIYPTKIRDMAIGFLFFATRIGGLLSQILYIQINNLGLWIPYYCTIIFCVINIVLIFLLPIETHYRPLDEEIEVKEIKYIDENYIEDKQS